MPAHIRAMRLEKEQTMQAFLLDLDNSHTAFHSETDAGAIVLPEQPIDFYDSLDAVTETEAERDDVRRSR